MARMSRPLRGNAIRGFLSAGLLIVVILLVPGTAVGNGRALASPEEGKPAPIPAPGPLPKDGAVRVRPWATGELTPGAKKYYQSVWGVEILGVKTVSSGEMIRFSYRVMDARKAKTLNDKKATPLLIDQKTRASLVVPTMEKVGQLRESSTPVEGREYWMLFSNKGNLVRPGSHVDVVIGNFRANGLIVQEK